MGIRNWFRSRKGGAKRQDAPRDAHNSADAPAFEDADPPRGAPDLGEERAQDDTQKSSQDAIDAVEADVVFEADEVLDADPKPRLDDFDFTGFWHDTKESVRRYISAPPDHRVIRDVEQELGYRLPASYVELMKKHNGGLVNRCWCALKQPAKRYEDYIQITCILGIGRETPYSLCGRFGSQFLMESYGHNTEIGIAIANTNKPGRLLVFLDYRKCGAHGEPQVMCADRDTGEECVLAKNFEAFIRSLQADAPQVVE